MVKEFYGLMGFEKLSEDDDGNTELELNVGQCQVKFYFIIEDRLNLYLQKTFIFFQTLIIYDGLLWENENVMCSPFYATDFFKTLIFCLHFNQNNDIIRSKQKVLFAGGRIRMLDIG
jgi:hypothetical protein